MNTALRAAEQHRQQAGLYSTMIMLLWPVRTVRGRQKLAAAVLFHIRRRKEPFRIEEENENGKNDEASA
jgi:hypothetical protein